MSKNESDYKKKVKVWRLPNNLAFSGHLDVLWGKEGGESIRIYTNNQKNTVRFSYQRTDMGTGEKKDINYTVSIARTSCHFGGQRNWFICPLLKDGKPCGRRVGVLYLDGDWFGCRHCYELTYESRNLSGIKKRFGKTLTFSQLEDERKSLKRFHYRQIGTRKHKRYLKHAWKTEKEYVGMSQYFSNKISKIMERIKAGM